MPSQSTSVLRAVVLGNDAFLAARPAVPLQLIGACLRAGWDLAVPAMWGEELLAERTGEHVRLGAASPVVPAHCPYVAEALRSLRRPPGTCLPGVAPPVAVARYLRSIFPRRHVHVLYVGRCPGAASDEVDQQMLPEALLGQLLGAGVAVVDQPPHLEAHLPPELARHASMPGGIPASEWLSAATGAVVQETAPATLGVLPRTSGAHPVVADLHAACGCACAHDRFALRQLEPPRTAAPTALTGAKVTLRNGPPLWLEESVAQVWMDRTEPPPDDDRDSAPSMAGDDPEILWRLTWTTEPWITGSAGAPDFPAHHSPAVHDPQRSSQDPSASAMSPLPARPIEAGPRPAPDVVVPHPMPGVEPTPERDHGEDPPATAPPTRGDARI